MNEQQTVLSEVERCRAQLHQLIDDQLDAFMLQITCGDLSDIHSRQSSTGDPACVRVCEVQRDEAHGGRAS